MAKATISAPKLFEQEEELTFFEDNEDLDDVSPVNPKKILKEIAEILVAGTDWTTATLLDQLVKGNIQLKPKFQRRDAWNVVRKSRFIESIILGFPVPHIVLASIEKERGKFIVLDGKQRLLAILQFYGESDSSNNSFRLKGCEFRQELNGLSYKDLKSNLDYTSIIDSLDNQTIRTTLIRNWQSEDLLYKVFLRLNVESTPLSPQELRQALHPGSFVTFLDDQAVESKALRRLFKSKDPDFRMRDNELLMRYMGFHYFLSEYRGDLKAFLDMTCKSLNKDWESRAYDIQEVAKEFEFAIDTTISIFGEKNFSRTWLDSSSPKKYRSQFNRAILDVMVFYFSDASIREVTKGKYELIEDAFKKLCSTPENRFRESVEGNTKNINETYNRLSLWGRSLRDILDVDFNVPELLAEENRILFSGLH
jgi:hypothetical protein